jgi:hypothetical protein
MKWPSTSFFLGTSIICSNLQRNAEGGPPTIFGRRFWRRRHTCYLTAYGGICVSEIYFLINCKENRCFKATCHKFRCCVSLSSSAVACGHTALARVCGRKGNRESRTRACPMPPDIFSRVLFFVLDAGGDSARQPIAPNFHPPPIGCLLDILVVQGSTPTNRHSNFFLQPWCNRL